MRAFFICVNSYWTLEKTWNESNVLILYFLKLLFHILGKISWPKTELLQK